MNPENVLLLGLCQSVTAIAKDDGRILWTTELPVALNGDDFVTMISDEGRVYAHTEGKLHCLDLETGKVLWSNSLSGYGFGIASLCFPGGASAPFAGAVKKHASEEEESSAS